jgi:hypothetical protein
MIPAVTYLISSHVGYAQPAQRLVESMRRNGVERFKVAIADCGVADLKAWRELPGVLRLGDPVVPVAHNSFDYTAAIAAVDGRFGPLGDHVFLLHDTMEFGPATDRLIRTADPACPVTAVYGGQCNLLLLRTDYLRAQADWLRTLRNCSKEQAIAAEGELWRRCPEHLRGHYPDSPCLVVGEGTPYGGATRIQEFYPAIDLTKWKANWGQPGERVLRA